ncbi:MAG: Hpt domain-containing protein [Leptospiraceae bacterium]|nr:Hpt domain-containing protein [Leptospiraceae bacterium]
MDYKVEIDSELEELIPTYIGNLKKKAVDIDAALQSDDFETCRILGHNMKGSGGGYGLDFVSECGLTIESAAEKKQSEAIQQGLSQLQDFLAKVEISYI